MLTAKTYFYLIWFPFAVLLAAGAAPFVLRAVPAGAAHYPLLAGLLVAAIALWFKRSRIAQISATFAVFGFCLILLLPNAKPTSGYDGQVIYALIALAAPLNMLIIAFLPNRPLRSPSGLARVLVIALQGLAIYILGSEKLDILPTGMAKVFDHALIGLLHFRPLPPELDFWTFLPQPALLLCGLALAVLLLRLMVTATAEAAACLIALLAFALALHRVDNVTAAFSFHLAVPLIFLGALVHEAYRMAFMDELSEIANRRALDSLLAGLRGRYAIAMMDIDHFKKFNDTYGHDVGDQVLKMVASCIAKTGAGGRAFRYGGEEFTLVFPGKAAADVHDTLEALRLDVQNSSFSLRGEDRPEKKPKAPKTPAKKSKHKNLEPDTVSVTISIGIAEPSAAAADADAVIKAADANLYKAKKAGRNRVAG